MKITVPRYREVWGLPDRAIPISNTQRRSLCCLRAWYLRYVVGLDAGAGRAASFGLAWHTIMEDIHCFWRDEDMPYEVVMLHRPDGPLHKIKHQWFGQAEESQFPQASIEEAKVDFERLTRVAQGYLVRYGGGPLSQLKVIGVEQQLAAPILNPSSGKPYRPLTYLLREGNTLTMAGTADLKLQPEKIVKVRWPYYQVGTLDVSYEYRKTGDLYVGEGKSAASPQQYIDWLTTDPQVAGYGWLLRNAAQNNWMGLEGRTVAGYFYEAVSSKMHVEPKLLKKGGLSKAKNCRPPSWIYMAAVLQHRLDPAEYMEHIQYLRSSVDPKLYLREWGTFSEETFARYETEIFGIAKLIAQGRRSAVKAKVQEDLDVAFPRLQQCQRTGAYCSQRGPCIQDGEIVRQQFTIAKSTSWVIDEAVEVDQESLIWE
jgi:hypothetical protein